jgi:serine/threonine protein kinase/TolB-like protein
MDSERWQVVQTLFIEARELGTVERESLLASRCAGDPALLEEVRSLLAADLESGTGAFGRLGVQLPPLQSMLEEDSPEHVGPYVVSGVVGAGGMGIVYRAHDPRLQREIALKFLPRALLRNSEAKARFVAEARAASALDHPHICTIHDIGSTSDGRLFIAMAYYGQGTLDERLAEGPLSPWDAARIAIEVASALGCAHDAGVVHRDIKPANIAFTDRGDAKVLDFGIAALGADGDAAVLAGAGTPRYMAPEQRAGAQPDPRMDIFSLGLVLHEMLTGEVPAGSADPETVRKAIADAVARSVDDATRDHAQPGAAPRHAARSDVARRQGEFAARRGSDPRRPNVGARNIAALAAVVSRAIAADPDRRFATAAEMAGAVRAAMHGAHPAPGRRRRSYALLGAGLVLLAGTAWIAANRAPAGTDPGPPVAEDAVVVLPFRVSADPALGYLRDGMVDLLAAKLTGEGGLRAADPRTVHSAMMSAGFGDDVDLPRDTAAALARRLGAGNVLLGDIVGTADRLVVNATLTNTHGEVLSRATAEGAHADFTDVVDRLVAQLLSLRAGEEPQRLTALTSASLPALHAYLEGQAAYRRGRYEEALQHHTRALDIDSTFALAALASELAYGWVGGPEPVRDRARRIAWRERDRLSAPDRAMLVASVGASYPDLSTTRQRLEETEEALRLASDRVELWYMLGDIHYHHGRILDIVDWQAQSEAGLRRAVELDANFAAPVHHLVGLYALRRDTAELRAMALRQLAVEPVGATADYIRWRAAAALGDSVTFAPPPLDSMDVETLGWIAMNTQDEGFAVEFGREAVRVRESRPGTRDERLERRLALLAFALNGSQPDEASRIIASLEGLHTDPTFGSRLAVLTALYAGGSAEAGARAVDALRSTTASAADTALNRCVLEQWRLWSDPSAVPGPRDRSRAASATGIARLHHIICDAVLDAMHEVRRTKSADAALSRLDAVLGSGPITDPVGDGHTEYAHIALARMFEQTGDTTGALAAVRRRIHFLGWQPYLAESLREEGRLALLVGDSGAARTAWSHALALQPDPEASKRGEVDRLRAELARLGRADGGAER